MQKACSSVIIIFLIHCFTTASGQHVKVKTWYDVKKLQPKEVYYVLKKNPEIFDSLYTEYYQNGNIKSKGYYRKNKATGLWEHYYENGNLSSHGGMKDNQHFGVWTNYYESGVISSEGSIEKGVKEGEWRFYYENGSLKSVGDYEKGRKMGSWKFFHEDSTLKAKAEFQNDKGIYKEYYSSGKVKSEGEIFGSKSSGPWKYYYEDGQIKAEGIERDGLKEGSWKYYHPNGQLASEGSYLNGKEQGQWKYYHDNGKLSSEGATAEGQKEGEWKLYYPDGALKGEGNFKQGDGLYKEYYESGKLKEEGLVKKGKKEGEWKSYYENNAKKGYAFYTGGKGNYTGFYETGEVQTKGRIENDKPVGMWTLYRKDGSIQGSINYINENQPPVFTETEQRKDSMAKDTVKQTYGLPTYKPRFKPPDAYVGRVNEYRGFILSVQPFGLFRNHLPVSLEYYFQERLGLEGALTFYRNPFFSSQSDVPNNYQTFQGFSTYFRQKYYEKDKDFGMIYWAQEFRFSYIDYRVNSMDSNMISNLLVAKETLYELSVLLGDRFIKSQRNSSGKLKNKRKWRAGWTIDSFIGIGIGLRNIKRNYISDSKKDALFIDLINTRISVPFRFGVSIGYSF